MSLLRRSVKQKIKNSQAFVVLGIFGLLHPLGWWRLREMFVMWATIALGLIPAAIWEILKARREAWRDVVIEVPVNE